MNNHKALPLFTAFSDINDNYISDAFDETPHKNKWYLNSAFLGISAACFCLIAVVTAAMIALGGSENLSAFFSGNSNTSSHSDYSNYSDSIYDTLVFNDTNYRRYAYITDTSSLSTERWGIAETIEDSELTDSFDAYKFKGFSILLCIAVKFDDNTYCCYTSDNFGYSLTTFMNSIQNTDAIKLNSVSTAFSDVKRDGSHSKLLYKGMTSEMLKEWLSNTENLIDDSGTYDDSPVLLSFDLSIPALDEKSSVTVTISVEGTVYFILGGQPMYGYNIGEDTTKDLYKYITTQLNAYTCEYTADNPDQPVISPLPNDRVLLFTGYITELNTDENTQLLTVTVNADYFIGEYKTMNVKNNLDLDSLKIGKRVRLYSIKSSGNSKPSGFSMDIIS